MDERGILVIEDDEAIASGLLRVLESHGYAVRRLSRGAGAVRAADATVDLVVLDLGLPDVDGLQLCRRLRAARPDVAILILTARDNELDIVSGLDAGGDDYLVKPFRLSELLARIRSHLRRVSAMTTEAPPPLEAGELRVDRSARRAWLGTQELALRPKEFDLLALFVANAGIALTRERIMDEVWDTSWMGSTKTLDTHVSSLRKQAGRRVHRDPSRSRLPLRVAVKRRLVPAIAGVAACAVVLFAVPFAVVLQRNFRDQELLRLQRDTVAATRSIDLTPGARDRLELPASRDRLAVYNTAGTRVAGHGPLPCRCRHAERGADPQTDRRGRRRRPRRRGAAAHRRADHRSGPGGAQSERGGGAHASRLARLGRARGRGGRARGGARRWPSAAVWRARSSASPPRHGGWETATSPPAPNRPAWRRSTTSAPP